MSPLNWWRRSGAEGVWVSLSMLWKQQRRVSAGENVQIRTEAAGSLTLPHNDSISKSSFYQQWNVFAANIHLSGSWYQENKKPRNAWETASEQLLEDRWGILVRPPRTQSKENLPTSFTPEMQKKRKITHSRKRPCGAPPLRSDGERADRAQAAPGYRLQRSAETSGRRPVRTGAGPCHRHVNY